MEAGLGHPGLQVVAYHLRRNPAEVAESPAVRTDPIRQALAPTCLGIGQVRGTESGHKELRLTNLTSACVDHLQRGARVVDKYPLPGDMVLAHHRCQPPVPAAMQIAEAAVAVALWMNGAIFLPQQRQRHARPLELTVDRRPVRLCLDKTAGAADRVEQQCFQLSVRHLRSKGPGKRGPFNPLQILVGRALPDAKARRDLPGRQSAGVQPQRFSDLPHRQSLHGATCSG